MIKPEGTWPCTALGASYGENEKGALVVRINVQIDEGPAAGQRCTYEDEVNTRSSIYVARSCKAVGWKGDKLADLGADVAAWIAETGGKTTVEIRHLEIRNGKRAGQIWDKVNAIGRGPKPLKEASASVLADADAAMRDAMIADGADDDGMPF